ncbi:MAG: hypothetical protein ACOCT0_02515 [Halobacteriota archaeon]
MNKARHLGTPVKDRDELRLEEAIEAYKMWADDSSAFVESADQRVTHKGFEDLLSELRERGVDVDSVSLSRLIERFSSLNSHILDEDEVKSLLKRYPDVAFQDEWTHEETHSEDGVDLVFKSEETGDVLLVETSIESGAIRGLGNLLYQRERFDDALKDEVHMCLVALEADDFLRGACDMSDVVLLELGPTALVNRVERYADWSNLRGLTITP